LRPFSHENIQLLLNNKITFVCAHQHVKIQFVAREIKNDLFENNAALYLKLPDHLLRIQRRSFFRIDIPHTSPVKCIIPIQPENPGEAVILRAIPLVDISLSGIRLLCEIDEITLLPNTTFPNCQIELPTFGLMTVTIEVRNVISFASHDNVTRKHIGCRFIHLDNQTAMLQDYISRMECKTLVLI
jgi:c-di-GMP-binding flagellar brake protein YcgR